MVVQLLALGRHGSEEGAAGVDQVLALEVFLPVYDEIFLLRAHGSNDALGFRIPKEPQNPNGFSGNLVHGAKQRRFFVQRFASIGEEAGGDVQAAVFDKGKRCGIPGGVASGFEGCPQTAGREGGRIRLAAHQFLAGKLHKHLAVADRGDEGIMLFGGDAGHGLKPMGIMRRAFFCRPVFHGLRNAVGNRQIQRRAGFNALFPGAVGFRGKALLHGGFVKHVAAKNTWYVSDFAHDDPSFQS